MIVIIISDSDSDMTMVYVFQNFVSGVYDFNNVGAMICDMMELICLCSDCIAEGCMRYKLRINLIS